MSIQLKMASRQSQQSTVSQPDAITDKEVDRVAEEFNAFNLTDVPMPRILLQPRK